MSVIPVIFVVIPSSSLPMVALRRSALVASLVASCSAIPGTINRAGHLIVEESDEVLARRKLEDNPYTCDNPTGKKFAEEDWKVMGANLGGWLVLEPWITPSLFYQFLSSDDTWGVDAPQHTGMDSYTFCTALGPEEANRQLRRHWQAWVREEDIATMAKAGTTRTPPPPPNRRALVPPPLDGPRFDASPLRQTCAFPSATGCTLLTSRTAKAAGTARSRSSTVCSPSATSTRLGCAAARAPLPRAQRSTPLGHEKNKFVACACACACAGVRVLQVLLDIHCMKDSQNGFDNSGMAADLEWTSVSAQETEGITTFEHWPIRAAHWVRDLT
jgi:hypothetical protein